MKAISFALAGGIAAAALPAGAATISETTDYSSIAASPTVIASGTSTVTGTLTSNDVDFLALSIVNSSGPITLTFGLSDVTQSWASAGYYGYYSYAPFSDNVNSFQQPNNQWVSQYLGATTLYASGTSTATYTITPASGYTGVLYLALTDTFNAAANVSYSISIPTTSVSAVPVPAGGVLLLSALGLAALARRRKSI